MKLVPPDTDWGSVIGGWAALAFMIALAVLFIAAIIEALAR